MAPHWLNLLSWISIIAGIACFAVVLIDIRSGHPQKMKVMEWVWPLTCLYAGPFGLWAYWTVGRKTPSRSEQNERVRRAA